MIEDLHIDCLPENVKNFLIEQGFDLTKEFKMNSHDGFENYSIHHKQYGDKLFVMVTPGLLQDLKAYHAVNINIEKVLIEVYSETIKDTMNSLGFKYSLIKERLKQNKK